MIFFILICTFAFIVPGTSAMAETKSEVNKKISSLTKEINKLKKQKKKAVAAEKKQKKGTTYVYGGTISQSPLIVKNLTGEYLYITDSKYLDNLLIGCTGYVKKTGKTTVYHSGTSSYTCSICKSVKVSNKSKTIQKNINKKNKQLNLYKRALKDFYVLPSNLEVEVGDKGYLEGKWKYTGKYNSLKWTSNNNKIATVNQKGYIKVLKKGTVTISVKASASNKVSKCVLKITEPQIEEPETEEPSESEEIETEDTYSIFVDSSLVSYMVEDNGQLAMSSDADECAFFKGQKQVEISDNSISFVIADDCIWQKNDNHILEGKFEEILSSFDEIRYFVEQDYFNYIDNEERAPYLMELKIQENKLVRVIYTHNVVEE